MNRFFKENGRTVRALSVFMAIVGLFALVSSITGHGGTDPLPRQNAGSEVSSHQTTDVHQATADDSLKVVKPKKQRRSGTSRSKGRQLPPPAASPLDRPVPRL